MMSQGFAVFLSVCLAVQAAPSPARAQAIVSPMPVPAAKSGTAAALAPLLSHPGFAGAQVGMAVRRLDTGEQVFAHRADALMVPASNVKLVTTAAALSALGADFQFKTELLAQRDSSGNILGHLHVRGFGDPYLTPERIGFLASRLHFMGIDRIGGDIVVDDSYFDNSDRMAQGWEEDRTSHAYMAPAGAVSVSFNALMVHVLPAVAPLAPARILLDPPQAYGLVRGAVRTVAQGPTRVQVELWPEGTRSAVRVSGQIAIGDPGRSFWRRVDNPPQFAGEVLKAALNQWGVAVAGRVRQGAVPADMPLVHTALSPPLRELLAPLNKYSNNFMAMQLALVMGAERAGKPATWAKSHAAIAAFMRDEVGIDAASYSLHNASGLHSVNRLTADQLVAVLAHMHARPAMSVEYINSLAVAAGSGTLQDRMLGTPAAHQVRAKTGTLAQASALSGYTQTAQGVPLAFSLLVNNYRHISDVWAAQDRIASALAMLNVGPVAPRLASTQAGPAPGQAVAEDTGP